MAAEANRVIVLASGRHTTQGQDDAGSGSARDACLAGQALATRRAQRDARGPGHRLPAMEGSPGRVVELDRPPRILLLNLRAAAAAVPRAAGVASLPGGGGELPEVSLRVRDRPVGRRRLARYCRLCGYELGSELPPTYPHVLAFPLQLGLLTHRDFPFSPVGLVHMANEITRRRAIGVDERLSVAAHLSGLQPHPRGQSFEIVTEVAAGDERVWDERCTIIRRTERGESEGREEGEEELPVTERWRIPRSVGPRYAWVSGDHNPIRVQTLPARLFGFPDVVAPGMWTKARALAALRDRLPDALSVRVEFRRPIVLPAEVALGARQDDDATALAVQDASGKAHLAGTLRPASTGR
jgi:MaoC like domain